MAKHKHQVVRSRKRILPCGVVEHHEYCKCGAVRNVFYGMCRGVECGWVVREHRRKKDGA